MNRGLLFLLLGVVATAAAVLSFSALRDLALVCGFAPSLAWLLPVVVDAGAAAGSLVWLGRTASPAATAFARALALVLLGLSVAANALGHGLAAFAVAPAWWVVVIVSAVAPAVLGAVVHLAVLVGRTDTPARSDADEQSSTPNEREHANTSHRVPPLQPLFVQPTPTASDEPTELLDLIPDDAPIEPASAPVTPPAHDRAADLVAAGAGRRRLSRELGVTEYEARQLLAHHKPHRSTHDLVDA